MTFDYIGRRRNNLADALATLVLMIDIPQWADMTPIEIEQRNELAYCLQITTTDLTKGLLFLNIKNYLEDQTLSPMASKNNQHALQRPAAQFILHGGTLYKKSPYHVLLRCVDD